MGGSMSMAVGVGATSTLTRASAAAGRGTPSALAHLPQSPRSPTEARTAAPPSLPTHTALCVLRSSVARITERLSCCVSVARTTTCRMTIALKTYPSDTWNVWLMGTLTYTSVSDTLENCEHFLCEWKRK